MILGPLAASVARPLKGARATIGAHSAPLAASASRLYRDHRPTLRPTGWVAGPVGDAFASPSALTSLSQTASIAVTTTYARASTMIAWAILMAWSTIHLSLMSGQLKPLSAIPGL